jgi:hypothetical protein
MLGGNERFKRGKWGLKGKRPDLLLEEVNGRRSSPPQNCPTRLRYEGTAKT